MINQQLLNMLFYCIFLVVSGAGEYFHLLPMGTLAVVVGGIFGHGVSNISLQNATQNTTPKTQ